MQYPSLLVAIGDTTFYSSMIFVTGYAPRGSSL